MNIKDYITKYNLTQTSMAKKLDVTIPYFRQLMLHTCTPSKKLAIKIEQVTNGEITKEEAMFFEDANQGVEE